MASLAENNVVQLRPQVINLEERVARVEDGYTKLANELYEELIGANLTRNQAKVAHAICRKTYGFNKKTDRISDSQLAELTRLPRQKVNKAKNELIAMKVIVKVGMAIGPNKNLTEWDIPDCHQNGVIVTKTVTKSVTKSVTALSPKQGHTKETITKEKKESNTPLTPHEVKGGESAKPTKRKSTPINYDEYLNAYNEEVGDRLPHAVEANEKRKTRIRKIIKNLATSNVDGWRAYVRAFVRMAKPFYFGENDTGWTADIDYLLRETTLTGVREGKFADRGF
ncbi:replication protein [Proteus mirabilis]|uniref:replication protein n=1 Tax=Proteus TaxID=583 RepID=UPI000B9FE5FD|nr:MULTISPECIES: replication protein [Proteus]ELB2724934.1 replication protein [Proteus mirabilis]ELN3976889.1 replication protein [Proteus mirabilis]EMA4639604.1 replication protein [Proteus mirabilis]MDK3058858.1 replication protein [Proteus mirabilis]NBM72635.1 DNA replication protein [Proteus sp. G4406]